MLSADFKSFVTGTSVPAVWIIFALLQLLACKSRTFNAAPESDLQSVERVDVDRRNILTTNRFDLITPTGERVFAAAKEWMRVQEREASLFAAPFQGANNISRVFEMAGLSSYSSPVATDIMKAVRNKGGLSLTLPKNKKLAAASLEKYFGGLPPAGTLMVACRKEDCSATAGESFLAFAGDIDSSDLLQIYHNNSYAPENRPWRPHMIPLEWFRLGFTRKWMPTPWLSGQRDSRGGLTEIESVLPEIEQLDPENYFVSLYVIAEIVEELKSGAGVVTDGAGSVMPHKGRLQNLQTFSHADSPPLAECKKLKTNGEALAFLREKPQGRALCRFTPATPLEKLSLSGSWSQVKGVCPDGRVTTGFVLSAHVVPSCE